MTKLSKVEKENIVLFNEGEDEASIYTYNAGLKKRLAAFSKKYPELYRLEETHPQGGVRCLGQKPTVHPVPATVQRGAQGDSQ